MNRALLLEKYFENSLSAAEALEFNQLLAVDEEFAKAFAFERDVKKAYTLNERAKLKQKLKSFDEGKRVQFSTSKWYYAAACFFVIAGLSIWFSLTQSSQEELFSTYYQTYPNVVAPTVRGAEKEDLSSKAFSAYDKGNYKDAAQLFAKMYSNEGRDYALLYQAVSLIELKEYEAAKQTLKKFDFDKKSEYSTYYKWYLALTELKTNETQKAILTLNELAETENPMQEM
ncbi:MAG: tetratricopeptide repeat protein, partial [Bacteroidia bacterium]